ncbi:unnamed protein product [Protopolystoma xenopodis]|uniref:Glycosyl hydrolase family 13 catalytic domain-containing protein n=1 Tax=Protopolystoma xenopodis TaxID=117903 RepID=A0A3S5B985_9PLAT|nr:unnamed protein product [Protopolystoma xenopodis]
MQLGGSPDEVAFLPDVGINPKGEDLDHKRYDRLLTKEELLRLDREEPFWRRLRLILFIAFWIIWVGLLVASILIIVFSPKCPLRPKQEFWNHKVGYWVDPFAFRDSDGDFIGDLKGLSSSLSYIHDSIGAGYLILTSMLKGHYTNGHIIGLPTSLTEIDPVLGGPAEVKDVIKAFKKQGIEVVITLGLNGVSTRSELFSQRNLFRPTKEFSGSQINRNGQKMDLFYGLFKDMADFDHRNPEVVSLLKDAVKLWLDMGFDGIVLTDAAFFAAENISHETEYNLNVCFIFVIILGI